MDLSPNDIRTYEFPSQMRGYDKEEVDNFLEQAAQALDNVKQENLRLSMEIDSLKSQVSNLKEYEDAIKKAAIDARRNADATVESAKNEAAEILVKAKQESESVLGQKENQLIELREQIETLENTKKSFILEVRKIINSHLDMIDETAQEDIKKNLSEVSRETNGESAIVVTESSDVTRDSMETVAEKVSTEEEQEEEDTPAEAAAEKKKPEFDDEVKQAIESQKNIDPELAAALEKYQKPTTVSDGTEDQDEEKTEHGSVDMDEAPKPGQFVETDKRAEDVPDGFIVGSGSPETNAKEVDTDKVNISEEKPAENPPANIAEELDNVVAKFEEEMDKAEKN